MLAAGDCLIRPYGRDDFKACCGIFQSNVPRYFTPEELSGYQTYLNDIAIQHGYWVMMSPGRPGRDSALVAAGGVAVESDGVTGTLCYGMVHADYHGQGLGTVLAHYRLEQLKKNSAVQRVRLETTQHTAAFFEKQGFKTVSVTVDYYGPGFDRYEMMLCP